MVNLKEYRQIIQDILKELHSYDTSVSSNIESQIIFDTEHDHYLLVDVGWEQKEYVYGTIIHLDIKGDKIWIQRNNTDINLAEYFVQKGVPKDNIVIGLHSPFMRKFSGYAIS